MSTWRQKLRPVIERVIRAHGTDDRAQLRNVLRAAFPFNRREGWIYRVWLDEIKRQLGEGKYAATATEKTPSKPGSGSETSAPLPGQKELF